MSMFLLTILGYDYAKAIALYNEVYEKFPNTVYGEQARFMLSVCYAEDSVQQDQKSHRMMKKLVKEYPQSELTKRMLGRYFQEGSSKLAAKHFQQTIDETDSLTAFHYQAKFCWPVQLKVWVKQWMRLNYIFTFRLR